MKIENKSPLKLMKYLCDIVSFEQFTPIKNSQTENITEAVEEFAWSLNRQSVPLRVVSQFAEQVAEVAASNNNKQANSDKKSSESSSWDIKADSYKTLYLVYELHDPVSHQAYPVMAIPTRVNKLNMETGTYYLLPIPQKTIQINSAYLKSDNNLQPALDLGDVHRYSEALAWLKLEPLEFDSDSSDWKHWHNTALTLLEKTAGQKVDAIISSARLKLGITELVLKASLKSPPQPQEQDTETTGFKWQFDDVFPKNKNVVKDTRKTTKWSWARLQHSIPENTIENFAKNVARVKEQSNNKNDGQDSDNKLEEIELEQNSYKDIYLVYDLYCSDTKESYQFLAIPAKVDNLDTQTGSFELRPVLSKPVLVNSAYLSAKGKPKPDLILGTEDKCGQAKIEHEATPEKVTDCWEQYHNLALDLLEKATGVPLQELPYLAKRQLRRENITINASLALGGSSAGALGNILSLYDYVMASPELCTDTPMPHVLDIHDGKSPVKPTQKDTLSQDVSQSVEHILGHMDETKGNAHGDLRDRELFALDNSQRLVAYKLSQCKPGDVLAVNGPPGSGKTAMLKAVIGHQWVYAAYKGLDCPITIAVGATNQSVTNVIDAFPDVIYKEDKEETLDSKDTGERKKKNELFQLYKRWIPECHSYGTYFPAQSRLFGENAMSPQEQAKKVIGVVSGPSKPNVLEWFGDKDGKLSSIKDYEKIVEGYKQAATEAKSALKLGNVDELTDITQSLQARIKQLVKEMHKRHQHLHNSYQQGLPPKFRDEYKPEETRPQAMDIIDDLLLISVVTPEQIEAELVRHQASVIKKVLKEQHTEYEQSISRNELFAQFSAQAVTKLAGDLDQLIAEELKHNADAEQAEYFTVKYTGLEQQLDAGIDRACFDGLQFSKQKLRDQAADVISKLCLIGAVSPEQKENALINLRANLLKIILRERIADEVSYQQSSDNKASVEKIDVDKDNSENFTYIVGYSQELSEELKLVKEYSKDAYTILVDRLLDVTYRAELFHYAARYWEGCYLEETGKELLISRTEHNVEKGLRRMCMLTPCLVSTLHTMPKLFALDKAKSTSLQRYLLGKADLLIMDETGQAQQRLAMPLLALTKRVLAVGDVMQLQPVIPDTDVSITEEQFAFRKHGYSEEEYRHACSNKITTKQGSMLNLLLRASKFSHQEEGLLLRGHYRCQTNIIQICNEMVYKDKLFFMPRDGAERGPFHSFCWANSSSPTQRVGSSRVNYEEAQLIADFIFDSWNKIYNHYKKQTDKKGEAPRNADKLIAIVTPFSKQSDVLRESLLKKLTLQAKEPLGLTKEVIEAMTINTVDSLQGAERPVVIFSGVHGSQNKDEKPFFADQPFLINVAVSRAQDCFIAFICQDMYQVATQRDKDELEEVRKNSAHYLGYYLGNATNIYKEQRCQRLFPTKLVVIEAGGKRRSLQEYLGTDYQVLVTGGSITELNDCNLEQLIDKGLNPGFKLLPNGEKVLGEIITAAAGVNEIILATDDDYVGEAIAWHIKKQLEKFGHYAIANKLSRVRLKAITAQHVERAFKHDQIKALEDKLGIAKASSQVKLMRDTIDEQRVKAEIVRQIIDRLISKRYALIHDEATNTVRQQQQDVADLSKHVGDKYPRLSDPTAEKEANTLYSKILRELVDSNLININSESLRQMAIGESTEHTVQIQLSDEKSELLEKTRIAGFIDQDNDQQVLFSGSLGRVKVAVLDLLHTHAQKQLLTPDIEVVLEQENENSIKQTLHGKIVGNPSDVNGLVKSVLNKMEFDGKNELTVTPNHWKTTKPEELPLRKILSPSTSTVEILEFAAREGVGEHEVKVKLLPDVTMASLQALYTGDD